MTNYEKIISLSPEEFADVFYANDCYGCIVSDCKYSMSTCSKKVFLDFLNSEYKRDESNNIAYQLGDYDEPKFEHKANNQNQKQIMDKFMNWLSILSGGADD